MRYLTIKNVLLSILGISIILIAFRFSRLISFPDARTLDKGDVIKIFSGQTFSQKFTANRSNLDTLQILLRTPGIKSGDTVEMQLADDRCNTILRDGILERPFLNTDDLYIFHFPRIEESKGTTYCLLLSYKTKLTPSKYLRFFTVSPENPAFLLTNTALNAPINGQALAIRPAYRNDHFWQDLIELDRRISQYKPWFLKNYFLAAIVILFIALSIALLLILISTDIKTNHTPTPFKKKEKHDMLAP